MSTLALTTRMVQIADRLAMISESIEGDTNRAARRRLKDIARELKREATAHERLAKFREECGEQNPFHGDLSF